LNGLLAFRLSTFDSDFKGIMTMLGTILIVLLILALLGAIPTWGHSRDWGYRPSGGVGLILLILIILVVSGRV
jgi:hypothetical protein